MWNGYCIFKKDSELWSYLISYDWCVMWSRCSWYASCNVSSTCPCMLCGLLLHF